MRCSPAVMKAEGGVHWGVITSLIETAKLNDVDPQARLADVLERARSQDRPRLRARPICRRNLAIGTPPSNAFGAGAQNGVWSRIFEILIDIPGSLSFGVHPDTSISRSPRLVRNCPE
jgi:hypothetical protein